MFGYIPCIQQVRSAPYAVPHWLGTGVLCSSVPPLRCLRPVPSFTLPLAMAHPQCPVPPPTPRSSCFACTAICRAPRWGGRTTCTPPSRVEYYSMCLVLLASWPRLHCVVLAYRTQDASHGADRGKANSHGQGGAAVLVRYLLTTHHTLAWPESCWYLDASEAVAETQVPLRAHSPLFNGVFHGVLHVREAWLQLLLRIVPMVPYRCCSSADLPQSCGLAAQGAQEPRGVCVRGCTL